MQTATMAVLGIVGFTALPTVAQQPATGTKVVQFMGLEGVKAKSSGRLTLEGGNLQFTKFQREGQCANYIPLKMLLQE